MVLKCDGTWTYDNDPQLPGVPVTHQSGAGKRALSGESLTISESTGKFLHTNGTYTVLVAGGAFRPWVPQLGPPKLHRRVQP